MKRAIIIGASSGLGHEVAKILINDGWQIGIAARRLHLLESLVELSPESVVAARIDVAECDAEEHLQELICRLGGCDMFFYASGIGWQNPDLIADIELNTAQTNTMGFTRMIGAAYRYMASNGGGHIVAISSIAGTKGLGLAPSYSATKAYQNTYLQALEQLANMQGHNIRFTDIRPGFVATELLGDNPKYPLLMKTEPVAKSIVKAVYSGKHKVVIDTRWAVITFFWRMIPDFLWRRLKVR